MANVRFEKSVRKTGKNGIFPKRLTAANVEVVRKIYSLIKLVNPPKQREMTQKCGVFLEL